MILTHGDLSFTALSVGAGPLVLCLHGFPDNARSFRHQLPKLAEAGYHAVSVMLRGYEPSSQPRDRDYTLETIAGDVLAFIDQLGAGRAHLIGHDWGAAITYTVGAMAPDRLKSLTAIAVPHSGRFVNEAIRFPKQLALSWYMGFFQLRGISERVVARNDYAFIRRLWRDWSPGWEAPTEVVDDVIDTLRAPGVTTAALSYYRAALAPRAFTPSARAAARFAVPVPTLAITGARDGCIDTQVFERLTYEQDFPGGVELQRIPDAGHFAHQEQPEAVNGLILEWLRRWEASTD
ncbi:MAG: alpha/beta hydrolase [Pseudomonadales bacterium]|jgi:pimeloyl-ACP methyl ester carboxylesterase